jgi:hypothetical protein
MGDFYRSQLAILSFFCLSGLILERYASTRRKPNPKEREDLLENGNPHGIPPAHPNALAVLTRQYLTVYAIVMGKFQPDIC